MRKITLVLIVLLGVTHFILPGRCEGDANDGKFNFSALLNIFTRDKCLATIMKLLPS